MTDDRPSLKPDRHSLQAFIRTGFPSAPLSAFEDFSHADLAAVEARMNEVIIPHRLLSRLAPPPGRFTHCGVDLGGAFLSSVRYDFAGGELRVRCPSMDEDYRFQVTLNGAGQVELGERTLAFGPRGFVIIHPDREFRERFDSHCHHLLLTVRRATLERAFEHWAGFPPTSRLDFESSVVDTAGEGRALLRHLAWICRRLQPLSAGEGRLPRADVDTLMLLILQTLRHNHSDLVGALPEPLSSTGVRRAEDYIQAHAREDVSMLDLVAAAGCSQRSLHYGFMRRRGLSPMQYLRDYRLNLARAELLSEEPAGRGVTEVALACGFTHMSKFTAAYRKRFGETPSATRGRMTDGRALRRASRPGGRE